MIICQNRPLNIILSVVEEPFDAENWDEPSDTKIQDAKYGTLLNNSYMGTELYHCLVASKVCCSTLCRLDPFFFFFRHHLGVSDPAWQKDLVTEHQNGNGHTRCQPRQFEPSTFENEIQRHTLLVECVCQLDLDAGLLKIKSTVFTL